MNIFNASCQLTEFTREKSKRKGSSSDNEIELIVETDDHFVETDEFVIEIGKFTVEFIVEIGKFNVELFVEICKFIVEIGKFVVEICNLIKGKREKLHTKDGKR